MTEYEKKLANPGGDLDPLACLKRRENDFFDPFACQKRKQELNLNLFARQEEREYLEANPGTKDIYGVLDEQKTKKKKYS